jgi:hypothetical protein
MNESEQVQKALQLFNRGIWWGHIPLPMWCATEHFVAIGDHGSGKTTIIELLLQSVLPRIRPGSRKRALLFDAKGDLYPFLAALKLEVPIKLLNPFDGRCHAWDMAADIPTFATALEIAAILFPQRNEDRPFFPRAAQAVLAGLMDGFNHTPASAWTLRDIVLALREDPALKAIINRSPNAPQVYEIFLKGERESTGDVAATIHTVMTRLTPVAAAWQGRPLLPLSQWCQDESVLVLGSTPTHEVIVRDLNSAIFHRLSQVILDQPEARTLKPRPQTWVVIDELTFAGHLPNLKQILATTRSKGGCFVLGFQHIGPVKEIYKEATGSIIAHCQNRAFLRTTDYDTQEFVSKDIGEYDAEIPHLGFSEGTSSNYKPGLFGSRLESHSTSSGTSVQYQRHTLPRISREQLRQNLYFTHERLNNGIPAYLLTPLLDRPALVRIPPAFLEAMRVVRPKDTPDRVPYDGQELIPWTPEDRNRLQLAAPKSKARAKSKAKTKSKPQFKLEDLPTR